MQTKMLARYDCTGYQKQNFSINQGANETVFAQKGNEFRTHEN